MSKDTLFPQLGAETVMETCRGGQFDGYQLTTDRDRQLCSEGGGRPEGRPDDGCGAATVQGFSAHGDRPVAIDSMLAARTAFTGSELMEALRSFGAAADPQVEQILVGEDELASELVEGVKRLEVIASRAVDPNFEGVVYDEESHAFLVEVARRVAERASNEDFARLMDSIVSEAESLVGSSASEVKDRLGPVADLASLEDGEVEVGYAFSHDLSQSPYYAHDSLRDRIFGELHDRWTEPTNWVTLALELRRAEAAIAEKARSLGELAAGPQGDVRSIAGGYVRRFRDCDIFWSEASGAHEIHGDIRAKYWQVNGATLLGLPVTDETSCPDGRGRYNHFTRDASIYWSPTTGPFWLAGAVRFRWASEGWEQGELGYPTRDQQSLPGLSPADNPDMHWSSFENGMVFAKARDGRVALFATVSARQIQDAFFAAFDRRMRPREYEIGLITVTARPGLHGVDLLGIDDTRYDFWATEPRTLRLRVRGFVSLPIVPDPTFEIDLGLRFTTSWGPSFTFPSAKSVLATLTSARVHVSGVMSQDIANELNAALRDAFSTQGIWGPAMVLATVPTGADQRGEGQLNFLDVMLGADGALNVYVNPLPPIAGLFRRTEAQRQLDAAMQQF